MESMNLINKLTKQNNGVILASSAVKSGLPRSQLSRFVQQGILERTDWGVYIKAGELDDELYSMQQRAKKIIYSHETALYMHGLTDRTPFQYSITVPSSYKPSQLIKDKCKIYYIKAELSELGKIELNSNMGNKIVVYDMERTICDIIRNRSKIDKQIFAETLKKYAARKDINLNRLNNYARQFRVYKFLHQYMEVLL